MSAELERLREKVRKDPNSRLFISLADLYRKEGMLEEAVRVLTEGLERQPDYMSARVALGKIYLEENKLDNALTEFSLVAKAIPDNLFAQRKLAGIYMMMEDAEKARAAFETVVRLNPLDTAAEEALRRLKEGVLPAPDEGAPSGTEVKMNSSEDLSFPVSGGESWANENFSGETMDWVTKDQVTEGDSEITEGNREIAGGTAWEEKEPKPVTKDRAQGIDQSRAEENRDLSKDDAPFDLEIHHADEFGQAEEFGKESFQEGSQGQEKNKDLSGGEGLESAPDISGPRDISCWFDESAPSGPADTSKGEEIPFKEDHEAGPPFDAPFKRMLEDELDELENWHLKNGQPETAVFSVSGPSTGEEISGSAGEGGLDDSAGELKRADELIHSGQYALGFMVLRRRLELFPGDLMAMQKLEELKVLIKLLGLENEIRASMLESFLQSAQKRKNGALEEKNKQKPQ